jgi:hypothetical protein
MMSIAGMTSRTKLSFGGLLSVLGGLGMALGPILGASTLPRPWSFLVGFVVGIITGLGVSLALAGLMERHARS